MSVGMTTEEFGTGEGVVLPLPSSRSMSMNLLTTASMGG